MGKVVLRVSMVDMGVVRVDSEEGGEAGDGKRKWMDLGLVFVFLGWSLGGVRFNLGGIQNSHTRCKIQA